jgi:hypothetical protein
MREEQGRAKGFHDSRFHKLVEVRGPEITLPLLRAVIVTACIEKLTATWEECLAELTAFNQRFGHCNVPQRWQEKPGLARWVNKQRQLKKEGRCSKEKVCRLESIGFVWNTREGA